MEEPDFLDMIAEIRGLSLDMLENLLAISEKARTYTCGTCSGKYAILIFVGDSERMSLKCPLCGKVADRDQEIE